MKRLFVYVLAISMFIFGCTFENEEKKFKKKEIAPKSLGEVSDGIASILKHTENIEKIIDQTYIEKIDEEKKENDDKKDENKKDEEKKEEQEDKQEEEQKQEEEKDQGNNEKQDSAEGKEDNNPKKSLEEEEVENKEEREQLLKNKKLEEKWEKIYEKIETVHEKWNSYESEGIKKGISVDKLDVFRNNLNKLTKSIEAKNFMEVYDFGSQALDNLEPLFGIYKDEIKGDVNKLKYSIYRSYLLSLKDKRQEAIIILKKTEDTINSIRIKLGEDKDKTELLKKTSISINDMRKALKEDSTRLNRIKRDIGIKNLEELGN